MLSQHIRPGARGPDYHVDADSGCWTWAKGTRLGYGRLWVDGRIRSAHVWYWEQRHGSVPKGLDLDHLCRNRACVNPDHLEPVTRAENVRRGAWPKLTRDQVIEIKGNHRESLRSLASRFGVHEMTIAAIRMGKTWADVPAPDWAQPRRQVLGKPTGRAELTEEDVAEIKAAPRYHGSGRELAHKYGVTDSVICAIRTGHRAGTKGRVI